MYFSGRLQLVGGAGPSLGILLRYPGVEIDESARTVSLRATSPAVASRPPGDAAGHRARISVLGSGNYATAVLIPAFKAAGADLHSVASSSGVSGVHAGRKFGFAETTTDSDRLFVDALTDAVAITTRHDSHARFVLQGLRAGKAVFVEKPLCLTLAELAEIERVVRLDAPGSPLAPGLAPARGEGGTAVAPLLMVGFNRRFAPQVQKIKALLTGVTGPKALVMTVNAGAIPADHWTQDPEVGGGRVIGEACHFIDLLRFLAGAPIVRAEALALDTAMRDSVSINLGFADGSLGTILYLANGSKAFPKERLEVFAAGRVVQLDNFRRLTGFGWPGFKKLNLWRQDKGQQACAAAFVQALRARIAGGAGASPIPLDEILEVSRVTIEVAASL